MGGNWCVIMLLCTIASAYAANIEKGTGKLVKVYKEQSAQIPVGDDAILTAGVNLEINCNVNVETEEIATVKWQLDGNELEFDGFSTIGYPNIRRYTDSTLTIYNIVENNAGEYTCVLVNPVTGEEYDLASSIIELANECMRGCEGKKGAKGDSGQRGSEGKRGKYGMTGRE